MIKIKYSYINYSISCFKKQLIIWTILFQLHNTYAQLDDYYFFITPYYQNPTVFANEHISSCRVFVENLNDSMPQRGLTAELEFNRNGELISEKRYQLKDSSMWIFINYAYTSTGKISEISWTWTDDNETEMAHYFYNSKQLLTKIVEFKKTSPSGKYKKTHHVQFIYSTNGHLLYSKLIKEKIKKEYVYTSDSVRAKIESTGEKFTYKNGLPVKKEFTWGKFCYEYNDRLELVKFYTTNMRDEVITTENYFYKNGLLDYVMVTQNRIDDVILQRRTYVYERYSN